MTKEEILDYVVNSPENTNRRVLNDMIDELMSSSGGGGGLIISAQESGVTVTLEKTWAEINAAFSAAQACVVLWPNSGYSYSVVGCGHYNSTYTVIVWNGMAPVQMQASSPDEYPSASFD